jgi:hypothetical protein
MRTRAGWAGSVNDSWAAYSATAEAMLPHVPEKSTVGSRTLT